MKEDGQSYGLTPLRRNKLHEYTCRSDMSC
jgi:hypothetical protein